MTVNVDGQTVSIASLPGVSGTVQFLTSAGPAVKPAQAVQHGQLFDAQDLMRPIPPTCSGCTAFVRPVTDDPTVARRLGIELEQLPARSSLESVQRLINEAQDNGYSLSLTNLFGRSAAAEIEAGRLDPDKAVGPVGSKLQTAEAVALAAGVNRGVVFATVAAIKRYITARQLNQVLAVMERNDADVQAALLDLDIKPTALLVKLIRRLTDRVFARTQNRG